MPIAARRNTLVTKLGCNPKVSLVTDALVMDALVMDATVMDATVMDLQVMEMLQMKAELLLEMSTAKLALSQNSSLSRNSSL